MVVLVLLYTVGLLAGRLMAEQRLIPVILLHLLTQRTSKLFFVGREPVILATLLSQRRDRQQEKICHAYTSTRGMDEAQLFIQASGCLHSSYTQSPITRQASGGKYGLVYIVCIKQNAHAPSFSECHGRESILECDMHHTCLFECRKHASCADLSITNKAPGGFVRVFVCNCV